MINWRDRGIIIDYRRHGESAAIVEIFSKTHGRHTGIVRGGGSRKNLASLQPGHEVVAEYTARLEEHLGSFRIDNVRSHIALLMSDNVRLAMFQSISALIKFAMTERDPHPLLFQKSLDWFNSNDGWAAYVEWELVLLSEAGFELELSSCAITGKRDELAYVSPKSGRAVSAEAAGEWVDRLLPYPDPDNPAAALHTTGYFLAHWVGAMIGKAELPKTRQRLLDRLS